MIDYTREDFTQNGQEYDLIFDAPGKSSFSRSKRSLKPTGQYLSANPGIWQQMQMIWSAMTHSRKVAPSPPSRGAEALASLRALIEAGRIKAVIDRHYPLEKIAEAHRYVETGRKKGSVAITVGQSHKI